MFLQKLWKSTLSWDDQLPEPPAQEWMTFAQAFETAVSFSIPRWLGTLETSTIELHGFSDASQDALGAVIYLRVLTESLEARSSLLVSKTKVAPLKPVTIARKELSAAVLLAQLMASTRKSFNLENVATHLWTDSTVTLAWVRSDPSQWKEYVANRVAEVQELLPGAPWRHISGSENPADIASRGMSPQQLKDKGCWWHGPEWLNNPSTSWPDSPPVLGDDVDLEQRSVAVHVATATLPAIWDLTKMYSKLTRLLRITAIILKAATKFKNPEVEVSTAPTPGDLAEACALWIRLTQLPYFPTEMKLLSKNEASPKTSPLLRLTPFVDSEGLMRLGGRLQRTTLDCDTQHPYIFSRRSELTAVIIDDAHKRTLHGGAQLTLATLRQRYWTVGGRATVRLHILYCVPCTRQRGKLAQQLMGSLPPCRTLPSRPFLNAGVIYAGPFSLKAWKGRCSKTYKVYFIIFVYLSTSAVHLEASSDYTSEGFLAAYRRFTSRRGICATLTSDRGTNLVSADAELRRLFGDASEEFKNLRYLLANDGTDWKFNPPCAPHFGGKWEAGVKSVKFHLRRVLREKALTYEEFTTLLIEIEGILNSRPLCPMSEDPTDFAALTPGHFLAGGPLNAIPHPSLTDVSVTRLSRWQQNQQMVERFWRKWSAEYLQRLQSISKWQCPSRTVRVGSVVLVSDERLPLSKWPLARVTVLHPGADGRTRVVTVRMATGAEMRRPIVKLCLLPAEAHSTDP